MSDKAPTAVHVSKEGKNLRIAFPADFRIGTTKAFMTGVTRVLREKPALVVLDARALTRVDGAALQAAVMAWRSFEQAGIAARWEGCPATFSSSAELLDLAAAAGVAP